MAWTGMGVPLEFWANGKGYGGTPHGHKGMDLLSAVGIFMSAGRWTVKGQGVGGQKK